MKLIIAGGRTYHFTSEDVARLDEIKGEITEVVTGGAPGADAYGEAWAKTRGIPIRVFKAQWTAYGWSAGPIRNRAMAQYGDAVALFPGNKGTDSMYKEAEVAGLTIFDFRS